MAAFDLYRIQLAEIEQLLEQAAAILPVLRKMSS